MHGRIILWLPVVIVVYGCAVPREPTAPANDTGYFQQATLCAKSATQRQQVQVPTGKAMTKVDISLAHNADSFSGCMERAGHPHPRVDSEPYRVASRKCLDAADGSPLPDDVYARCLERSGIGVDVEVPKARAR